MRRLGSKLSSDPDTHMWRKIHAKGKVPGPRSGAASLVFGDKLYIFGGYGGTGRLNDFFEYDFSMYCYDTILFILFEVSKIFQHSHY